MSATFRRMSLEQATPWVARSLRIAGLNERLVSETLRSGECSVIAPAEAPSERLERFDAGGIIAVHTQFNRGERSIVELPTYARELATTIKARRYSTCYFHDPLRFAEEGSPDDGPTTVVDGQLFYVWAIQPLSVDELKTLVERNSLAWHFLMLCFDFTPSGIEMVDLMPAVRCIVVGAYDGESYLLWERRSC